MAALRGQRLMNDQLKPYEGLFITFEGGEGAGKSTQIQRLGARLNAQGHKTITTREPGGSPKAELLREALLAGQFQAYGTFVEALMFYAARFDHLSETIIPALSRGDNVLCDRFSDSTRAYQGLSSDIPASVLEALDKIIVGSYQPDLTFLLDLPAETGLARAAQRRSSKGEGIDRYENEGLQFHQSLRQAFLNIAHSAPQRCVIIDAAEPVDIVEAHIWQNVHKKLHKK
jgi:dTMP kinase